MNYLELMLIAPCGKTANLTQAVSSCHNLHSELVRSLVFDGPIFNNFFLTFDDLTKELEFHPDL